MEIMVISKDFWKEKKVLITGHTGFKGSWLTILLNQLGADVYGISYEDAKLSLSRNINLDKFCNSNIIDIRKGTVIPANIPGISPVSATSIINSAYVLKIRL